MTRRTWIAIGLTVALLAAALLLPAWLVRRKDARLLAQPRVAEAALSDFSQEAQGSLMERIRLFASTQALAVYTDTEELLAARYGTPEEVFDRCIEELETLFPMEDWPEVRAFGTPQFLYYCDPGTGQSAMFAECYLEWGGALLAFLDLESGRIIALNCEDLNVLMVEEHDPPGWEAWTEIWASYLGLELAAEPSVVIDVSGFPANYDAVEEVVYTDPEDPSQQIAYCLLDDGNYLYDGNARKYWNPYPILS